MSGSGRTLNLLRNAPRNAVFIWCNDDLDYPRKLAKFLARGDIELVPLSKAERCIRARAGYVICDHAIELPSLEALMLEHTKH